MSVNCCVPTSKYFICRLNEILLRTKNICIHVYFRQIFIVIMQFILGKNECLYLTIEIIKPFIFLFII